MPLHLLRSAVMHNAQILLRLHDAHRRCDTEAITELLAELDLNNADLVVALEELAACPPTGTDLRTSLATVGAPGRSAELALIIWGREGSRWMCEIFLIAPCGFYKMAENGKRCG